MAAQQSDGSPAARGRASAQFSIRDEADNKQETTTRQASNVSLPSLFSNLMLIPHTDFEVWCCKTWYHISRRSSTFGYI